jgi:hypothetical protein
VDLALARLGAGASLGVLAGVLIAVAAHAPVLALRDRARRRRIGHRFLCPSCLRFGGVAFACQACYREIAPSLLHTRGRYTDLCPRCRTPLRLGEAPELQRVRAHCRRCSAQCDPLIYHRRQVRVLAALSAADLDSVHQAAGSPAGRKPGAVCSYDDGERLTYVLSEADLPEGRDALPPGHAARSVSAIWMDEVAAEPLRLVAEVDRLIQRAGWTRAQRQAITVCVRSDALDPTVRHLLAARFGAVRCDVTAAALLELPQAEGKWLPCAVLTPPVREDTSGSELPVPGQGERRRSRRATGPRRSSHSPEVRAPIRRRSQP